MVKDPKQEPEPVLTPLPRDLEKIVKAIYRRPEIVVRNPVQLVRIQFYRPGISAGPMSHLTPLILLIRMDFNLYLVITNRNPIPRDIVL